MLVINVYGTISKSCNYYANIILVFGILTLCSTVIVMFWSYIPLCLLFSNIGFEMESVEAVIIVNLCDFEHATTILLLL